MATIFLLHGTKGDPTNNWFPWLQAKLAEQQHQVIIPHFPTPEQQSVEHWWQVMEQYTSALQSNPVLIGHSLGATFALHLAERYPVKAVILIAGFIGQLGLPEFDDLNHTFVDHQFDWATIRKHCQKCIIFQSDNDPYVPLAQAETLSAQLNTTITSVPSAGHFNSAAGYSQFPQLLEELNHVLHYNHDHSN